jgi:hypothetical protein
LWLHIRGGKIFFFFFFTILVFWESKDICARRQEFSLICTFSAEGAMTYSEDCCASI